jgi:hypothetical protein
MSNSRPSHRIPNGLHGHKRFYHLLHNRAIMNVLSSRELAVTVLQLASRIDPRVPPSCAFGAVAKQN